MFDQFARLLGISTSLSIIILLLALVQISVQIYALIDVARRDAVRGGRKWIWALVVALGSLPGALVYLAVGRVTPRLDDRGVTSGATVADSDATRRALDTLYKPRDQR